jgi:hypothetical protein
MITAKQRRVYDFIRRYIQSNREAPYHCRDWSAVPDAVVCERGPGDYGSGA